MRVKGNEIEREPEREGGPGGVREKEKQSVWVSECACVKLTHNYISLVRSKCV